MHKTRETQIYVVHPVWATSTPNSQSFLSIIQQNEETQLQQIRCNILCFLSQSHLSISRSQNTHLLHSLKYNALIQREGLPSREKNPKLNISSTVRSSA